MRAQPIVNIFNYSTRYVAHVVAGEPERREKRGVTRGSISPYMTAFMPTTNPIGQLELAKRKTELSPPCVI